MKFAFVAIVLVFFILSLPALALAANNTTATTTLSLTPVSISQNTTISMPTPANASIMNIGTFENATVFISGGANATIKGKVLDVDMGEAAWMEYRDVYLFYRLPPGFASVSFDYDLHVGEKSNVLLLEFVDNLPKAGVRRGGVPDTAVLGLGTWTNMNSVDQGHEQHRRPGDVPAGRPPRGSHCRRHALPEGGREDHGVQLLYTIKSTW